MKTIMKFITAFVAVAFALALFALLSWPAFVIALLAIFWFTKKQPDVKKRNIAVVAAVVSLFGIILSLGGETEPVNDATAETESTVLTASESAASESAEKAESLAEAEEAAEEEAESEAKEKAEAEEKAAAAASESEFEVSNDLKASLLVATYNKNLNGLAEMVYDEENKFFSIRPLDEDLIMGIMYSANEVLPEETWGELRDTVTMVSGAVYETLGSGYTVTLLNPANEDMHIIIAVDGTLVYDALNE